MPSDGAFPEGDVEPVPLRSAAVTRRLSSTALMPLADVRDLLVAMAVPATPRTIALDSARERIVAEDIVGAAHPRWPVALHDGWAVEAGLLVGASPYAPVAIPEPPYVEAGLALPKGCDAVLPSEAIERIGASFEALADVAPGVGVRAAGADQREGEAIVRAGSRLGPIQRAALATAGILEVAVRTPAVTIFVTKGSEADVTGPLLADCVVADGGNAQVVAVPRDADGIAAVLDACTDDAIFLVGGTAFGRNDNSGAGLAAAGTCLVHGIALKPGDTGGLGRVGCRPVLLVPRRLDAALAIYLTLGRTLMSSLTAGPGRLRLAQPLGRKVASVIGLSEIVFVQRSGGVLLPLGGAEIPLRRLCHADGAVLVPPTSEGYPVGAEVELVGL